VYFNLALKETPSLEEGKVNFKLHHWTSQVEHHKFFMKGQSLPSPLIAHYYSEGLASFFERQDFLAPIHLF